MTQARTEELKLKIAAGAAKRAAKVSASTDAAALKRLENEAKLVDIEEETGLTYGVDFGVVWCRSGEMAVVRKPPALKYEKYVLACTNGKITTKDVDDLLAAPTMLYPVAGQTEQLWEKEPGAKMAAAELAQRLYEIASKDFEGK